MERRFMSDLKVSSLLMFFTLKEKVLRLSSGIKIEKS